MIKWWFVKISLQRHHALMVEDDAFSNKIVYVTIFKGIKIGLLVQNLWRFCWRGGFAYCWSCIGKGLCLQPAQQACFLIFKPWCPHLKQRNLWTGPKHKKTVKTVTFKNVQLNFYPELRQMFEVGCITNSVGVFSVECGLAAVFVTLLTVTQPLYTLHSVL